VSTATEPGSAGLTETVLETALKAEMSEHLGHDKHDPTGPDGRNSRSGTRPKAVLTEISRVQFVINEAPGAGACLSGEDRVGA
jgi:transposase-like protein